MKTTDLHEICDFLDSFFNLSAFVDYCPNGLQIEGKKTIKKMATAVSATLETIEEAVEAGVDALIVHHGLFWKGDPYPITAVLKKKVELLLKHEISLLAYHLPMDAHPTIGNNWKVALDLKWENTQPCGYFSGVPIGVMGNFYPIKLSEFITILENYYQHPVTLASGGKDVVSSAYLISGGAYKNLSDASKNKADCMITGNFDEPAWYTAKELGINFMAFGHSATERVGPRALSDLLRDKYGMECQFLDIYNPF